MFEFDPTLVHEWLCRSARRLPDKVALVCDEQHWTYESLDQRTDHLADIGLKPGNGIFVLPSPLLDQPHGIGEMVERDHRLDATSD